jgi:hypothetical protein
MGAVRLYQSDAHGNETEVGRLVDGQLEVGQYSSTTYPAHIDNNGTIMSGATFTPALEQRVIGRVSDDGRTILRQEGSREASVGTFDPDGTVYIAPATRQSSGRSGSMTCDTLMVRFLRPPGLTLSASSP